MKIKNKIVRYLIFSGLVLGVFPLFYSYVVPYIVPTIVQKERPKNSGINSVRSLPLSSNSNENKTDQGILISASMKKAKSIELIYQEFSRLSTNEIKTYVASSDTFLQNKKIFERANRNELSVEELTELTSQMRINAVAKSLILKRKI